MARVRKPQPTMESLIFNTPEQRVLRLLLSEPTTSFTSRVISSKLKGVRGLGGVEGIARILNELQELGVADFVDNRRAVRLHDDNTCVQILKTFAAICDLEGLNKMLSPIASKIVLYGSRSTGRSRSDSNYDIFVVSEQPEEVRKIAARHPLGKDLEITAWTPELFDEMERNEPVLYRKVSSGIVLFGSTGW